MNRDIMHTTGIRIILFLMLATAFIVSFISCAENGNAIKASGTIEATEVTISSKIAGEVIEMNVNEGSEVKKGDVIAKIDSFVLGLKKVQAQAAVDLAETEFSLLMKGARSEDIRQAEEQLVQAREQLGQAQADRERIKNLFETGSVPKKQLDDANTRLSVLQAQYTSAEQVLKKLNNLARPEDLKVARAHVDQAEAGLKITERQLSDCSVTAPIDGVITHKLVEAGEIAGAGTPLVVIANLDLVSVKIYVSETQLGLISIGGPAGIYIDSFPDKPFPGTIAFISQEAEFTPKNVQTKEERVKQVFGVKIEVANRGRVLKAGIPADAVIPRDKPGKQAQ